MTAPLRLACHCGAVELSARLAEGEEAPIRCDCSYCSRRGAVMVGADIANVEIIKGSDVLSEYRWGTRTAVHYFCSICGIYTHHQRRSNPQQFGLNAACIQGVDVRQIDDARWVDGKRHPADG